MAWGRKMRAEADAPEVEFTVDVPAEIVAGMTAGGNVAARISRREALQVPAVLRSRNIIAGTLSRLPMHVRDKARNIATPTTLFDQIDPDIPNVVTYAETYEDLLFEGISWWKVLEFGWHGFPTFATHIDVSRVVVSGWVPPVNGQGPSTALGPTGVFIDGRPVSDNQVIRFDSPNPPLLVHAARAIRSCLNLDMTAASYSDTPIPLGYFTPREGMQPKEDVEAIEAMLTKWAEARRRRVVGYVGSAWDLKQMAFDAEQIQLAEQRQHAVLEIARATGVDAEYLGVSTTSRTYQNSEQQRQDLIDFTLSPYGSAIEQRLSMRDIIPRGYEAKVNYDSFLRADTKTRMEAYQIGRGVDAYTEDEIRELEDRPNLTPAQRTANHPTPPPVTAPASLPQGVTQP